MTENNKCPVCGKTDIPDFLHEDVVCPCCGSDLRIYRVVKKIPAEGLRFRIWKAISAVAIIAVAVLGVMLYTQKPTVQTISTEEVSQLKDSIAVLNKQLAQIKVISSERTDTGFKYAVRHGDSYWSISEKFYGTGTRYQEIAEHNNRTIQTLLSVGDTLLIK